MRIGLIDVDGHNYPNLPLMKISAYHKSIGDHVEWYSPMLGIIQEYDKVYMSKVFSFSPDFEYPIYAKEVEKGGSGYCIDVVDGKEVFHKEKHTVLPDEIEHIYPDYSIYGITDTAYGFLSRGCPRQCSFCIVKDKEGTCSKKVADLSEFWRGQKHIELLDPNILACKEWKDLLTQLIESKAQVNFSQGLDIRMMTEEKADLLSRIKIEKIHFAWDRYEDKDIIQPRFLEFRRKSKIRDRNLQVYMLTGDRERHVTDQDLERVYWLRDNGFAPFVMIYDKSSLPKKSDLIRLQRWVNNRFIFYSCNTFEEYLKK